jgi:hypothetical protein
VRDNEVTPWASIRTMEPTTPVSDIEALKQRSRQTYGRSIAEVEAELRRLVDGPDDGDERPLGRRRRS